MTGCILDNRDGCKGLGGSAVGYWGRDIYKRIGQEQEYARQRVLLQDQINAGGIRADLWVGVTSGEKCACYKESNQQADRKCKSCYGVRDGYVPGYKKFGFETLYMTSVDADVTLTNVEITTVFKSSKVQLSSTATSGTIESGDKSFTRSAIGSTWEYEEVSFVRLEESSEVTVEYSIDSGSTWSAIAQLVTANPSSGVIRFRATLTRDTTSIISPLFEVVRARYSTIDLGGLRGDGSYSTGPWIRIMSSKPSRSYTKSQYGDAPSAHSMNFWMSGLSMFDSSIEVGSPEELLEGPDVVIKLLDGALQGKRYVLSDWAASDPGGYVLITQSFNLRTEDPAAPRSLIF